MERRRLGRLGHQSSVLIYGAAALGNVTQDVADESIFYALDNGINHFDVAAAYGDAEIRMGRTMPEYRSRIFLATKTGDRTADAAWASINRSLERLNTDHLDLIQLHEVNSMPALDAVTGDDGALQALLRARSEGLVRGIGITGHTHDAPAVHTEALRRFDFDSVLTPLNLALWRVPGYAEAFTALTAAAQARDVALMTIKTLAKRNWVGAERTYATWYEPFSEQRFVTAALTWVLNGHPEVTGIATAGETRLLSMMIKAEQERRDLSLEAVTHLLASLPEAEYSSPFLHMPW